MAPKTPISLFVSLENHRSLIVRLFAVFLPKERFIGVARLAARRRRRGRRAASLVTCPVVHLSVSLFRIDSQTVFAVVTRYRTALPVATVCVVSLSQPCLLLSSIHPLDSVYGPWRGVLANDRMRLRLVFPDNQNADLSVPFVEIDNFEYAATSPWPGAVALL